MNQPSTPPNTRERLISAMRDALSMRGFHGIGLTELLSSAGAPKGVLYHHFPGGKTELAIAAIQQVLEQLSASLDLLLQRADGDVIAALSTWLAGAQKTLEKSGFARGCPLATVALESTPDDLALRAALSSAFAEFRSRLALALSRSGVDAERSRHLAALIVSAYEGALLQARVAGDLSAMRDTSMALLELLRLSVPSSKA